MLTETAPMDPENGAIHPLSASEESAWGGVEQTIEDPEEVRVMFSALDSFA